MIDTLMDRQVSCMRDHVWAKRAFHLRHGHCERLHADHFRDGFIAGYSDVCKGGNGECPAVPPEKYWGFQYRTREGSEMQSAWFSGFEEGAMAANTDGTGTFRNIQISQRMTEMIAEAEALRNSYAGVRKATKEVGATWHNYNGQLVPESAFGTALADPLTPMIPSGGFYVPESRGMAPMANTPVGIPAESMMPPVYEDSSGFYPPPVPVVGPAQVPVIQGSSENK